MRQRDDEFAGGIVCMFKFNVIQAAEHEVQVPCSFATVGTHGHRDAA